MEVLEFHQVLKLPKPQRRYVLNCVPSMVATRDNVFVSLTDLHAPSGSKGMDALL